MNQPASRKVDLRQQMPETAKWVESRRAEYGREHVNDCIRRALAGEAGFFYAIERGLILGTPFPAWHPIDQDQRYAVMTGCLFAGFMRKPEAAP